MSNGTIGGEKRIPVSSPRIKASGVSVVSRILASMVGEEPKDIRELVDRMREDYQVQIAERVLISNIQSIKLHIVAKDQTGDNSQDLRAQAVAEMLEGIWKLFLNRMLNAIAYGRVAFEIVWDFDERNQINAVKKLVDLPFENTDMVLEKDGAFGGIRLHFGEGDSKQEVTLLPIKAWWLAIDATEVEPHGRSRFLGAPKKVWEDRQQTLALRKMFLKRFVVDGGSVYVPTGDTEEDGSYQDNMQAVFDAYERKMAGGIMGLPGDFDEITQERKYEWIQQSSTLDPTPIDNVLDGQDAEQLRAWGICEKLVMEGASVGSFSMLTIQMLILNSVVEDLFNQIKTSYERYPVKKALDLNFEGPTKPVIELSYQPLNERNDNLVLDIVRGALTATDVNPLLLNEVVDLPEVLASVGLPLGTDVQGKILKLVEEARLKAQSPPAAPGGFQGSMALPTVPSPADASPAPQNRKDVAALERIVKGVHSFQYSLAAATRLATLSCPSIQPEDIRKTLEAAARGRRQTQNQSPLFMSMAADPGGPNNPF